MTLHIYKKKNVENLNLNNNIIKVNNFNINFNKKIKIGYISYDFRRHPVSQLICDTFETHDKDRFEIYTFKLNSVFDSFTKKISNSTHLVDLSSCTIDKITSSLKKFKIDIAIDLMGFTNNSKPKIFYNKTNYIHVIFHIRTDNEKVPSFYRIISEDKKVCRKNTCIWW